jgi:hypothetical protein
MAASGLAWTTGAAASVAIGLLALSSIDAGSAAGPPRQLTPDAITKAGTAGTTTGPPTGSDTAPSEPPQSAPPPATSAAAQMPGSPAATVGNIQRLLTTPGGTVLARCTGVNAYLVSWSPAQGYRADHAQRGPAPIVEVTFRTATRHVEVEVHCVAGTPTLNDDGWNDDHNDD